MKYTKDELIERVNKIDNGEYTLTNDNNLDDGINSKVILKHKCGNIYECKLKGFLNENKSRCPKCKITESHSTKRVTEKDFISKLPTKDVTYKIEAEGNNLMIDMNGEDTGYLIGYRGEVLNSIQNVLTNIANKGNKDKVKVMLNIGGYREKREKDLENLAMKIAASVVKTGKSITLEPMTAYERKVIHTKLQSNEKVTTYSVGEEPYRKLVVALNK